LSEKRLTQNDSFTDLDLDLTSTLNNQTQTPLKKYLKPDSNKIKTKKGKKSKKKIKKQSKVKLHPVSLSGPLPENF
jgi:hypothetical protein